MTRDQARAAARAAVRDGAGRLRFRHQRARHVGRPARRARTRCMPAGYYALTVPRLLRAGPALALAAAPRRAGPLRRRLPHQAGAARHGADALRRAAAARQGRNGGRGKTLPTLLEANGFDREAARADPDDLREGRIGLAQNRLPASAVIEDVRRRMCSIFRMPRRSTPPFAKLGLAGAAPRRGRGGHAGRRRRQPLDQGAGVVKALHPFCKLGGRTARSSKMHLAKSRRVSRAVGMRTFRTSFTTSYLTHEPIARRFSRRQQQLRLRRPALSVARPIGRPADGADGARPALRVGGDAAADARRAGAEGAREPARRADRLGADGRRGERLHRQPAAAVPAPGRPLVRGAEPAPQRRAARDCSTSGRS